MRKPRGSKGAVKSPVCIERGQFIQIIRKQASHMSAMLTQHVMIANPIVESFS